MVQVELKSLIGVAAPPPKRPSESPDSSRKYIQLKQYYLGMNVKIKIMIVACFTININNESLLSLNSPLVD